jgi:FAD/FMN-containing dehydrogenase
MGGQQFASGAVLVDTRKLARVLKLDGADRLCLGGALAANVHGRGLRMKPIIDDVESLTLVDAEGKTHHCSRKENPELFRLAIGGYGLFGVIYSLTLRLAPRRKLQRTVEIQEINGLRSVTYHRYATREQVEACYPQFRDFLWLKKQYDPEERFQSDWYRYYKGMLA